MKVRKYFSLSQDVTMGPHRFVCRNPSLGLAAKASTCKGAH